MKIFQFLSGSRRFCFKTIRDADRPGPWALLASNHGRYALFSFEHDVGCAGRRQGIVDYNRLGELARARNFGSVDKE